MGHLITLLAKLNIKLYYFSGRVTVLEDRSLKLDDITLDDMGEYTCEADNAVGSITATGTLVVHGKYINTQPVYTAIIIIFICSLICSTSQILYPP